MFDSVYVPGARVNSIMSYAEFTMRESLRRDETDTIQGLKAPWTRMKTRLGNYHYHLWVDPRINPVFREAFLRMFSRAATSEGSMESVSWSFIPEMAQDSHNEML